MKILGKKKSLLISVVMTSVALSVIIGCGDPPGLDSNKKNQDPIPFWTQTNSGTGTTLYGIGPAGSQVVAVGALGTILTSPDGVNWAPRYSGTNYDLLAVAGSGSRIVAVGFNGTIVSSGDGSTWTTHISGTTNTLRGIAWTGSRFVAVGDSGIILTSPDGDGWSVSPSGTVGTFFGVTGSGPLIVAVGQAGIFTSPSGTVWTERISSASSSIRSVIWSGNQYLAAGDYMNASVQTSVEGITWIARPQTAFGNTLYSAAWSGTMFVVVGQAGVSMKSSDGIAWTGITDLIGPYELNGITYFGNRFIAVGAGGRIFIAN